MASSSSAQTYHVADQARRAILLQRTLRVSAGLAVFGLVVSWWDPNNVRAVTVVFYSVLLALLFGLTRLASGGHAPAAARVFSAVVFVMVALVTVFFGGLHFGNGAAFIIVVMLVGSLEGGRAAVAVAVASATWSLGVVALELLDRLPPPLSSYSPMNAWVALTITLVLTSVLLRHALDSLQLLHARAEAHAQERDLALRRSIESQKMELVGSLAAGVAHDLNNLLMVINGASHEIRRVLGDAGPDATESLDDLDAASFRAGLMTRQLLAFGKASGELNATDLGAVVSSLKPMLPRLLDARIIVRVDAAHGAHVRATRAGLEQILLNLVVNARDAMPDGGTLTVRVVRQSTQVILVVEDTGVGMDSATQERIFEPFFTTRATGTGLGLATVSDLVGQFRGTLEVDSTPGKGTVFKITMPAVVDPDSSTGPWIPSRMTANQAAVSATIAHLNGAQLLLVEDQALVRRSTQRLLEGLGLNVLAVSNGLEALALLERSHGFDVVMTDVAMPGLDGEGLARRLAEIAPDLPVILYGGNRAPGLDTLAAARRVFVPKPATPENLVAALAAVVVPREPAV
jgi:signal transduction histidine kinase/ActR/RegA family two-component response regulator